MAKCAGIFLLALFAPAAGRTFLGSYPVNIDPAYMSILFGSDSPIHVDLNTTGETLLPLLEALPKNQAGQLAPSLMRYAVRRYFSQQYGWTIKGFDLSASNLLSPSIVHRKARGHVEAELDKMLSQQGFSFQDILVIVASIETLILDENLYNVQTAYGLNQLSIFGEVAPGQSMQDLMGSYFLVEYLLAGETINASSHLKVRSHLEEWYPHWPDAKMFMEDVFGDDSFHQKLQANPFAQKQAHSFEDVARITRSIGEQFGAFSNHECHAMKLKLAEMDPYGTGRVKLADFYRASNGGSWQFSEASEELRRMGALDDSSGWLGPQVIIPNYIQGQHNCIRSSDYYEVCCLNECDGIFYHLEARIKASTASASEITRAIEGGITLSPLLSSTVHTEARNLSVTLKTRLEEIASHHNDRIPLHGRLFAQWLHYAFPQECSYPHMSGTVSRRTGPSQSEESDVTEEEIKQHIESEFGRRAPSPEAGQSMWTPQEELLTPSLSSPNTAGGFKRHSVVVVILVVFSIMVLKEFKRMHRIHFCKQCKEIPFSAYDI